MKQLFSFIVIVVLFSSCSNTWNQDDQEAFHTACMDDAKTWADPASAKTYCDCVIGKVMAKYPNVNDAVEQIETISKDADIQSCKTLVPKK